MKKFYLLCFAALCAAAIVSCNKESIVNPSNEEPASSAQAILNPVTLTFEANASTKVSINGEGKASWEEGDQVKIICFNANDESWTSEPITVEGGKISATVESADTYYAVYPASASIALANKDKEGPDSLTVTIPTEQNGTFKNACYYAAKTSSTDKCFNFKAVSGIIKFHAGTEYVKADISTVESVATLGALAGDATCTFNEDGTVNVSAPSSKGNTPIIFVDLDKTGTYYVAIPGNAENELAFRFKKDGENADFEPGVYFNNRITYAPAKIKNFGNVTDRIVTDVYVAPTASGTGDGKSAENAAAASELMEACIGNEEVKYTAVKGLLKYTGSWNCFRRNGLTIHFAAGAYTDAFTVAGNNSSFCLTLQGPTEGTDKAILKGGLTVSAARVKTEDHEATVTKLKDLSFSSSKVALTISAGLVEMENCVLSDNSNTSANGAGLVTTVDASVKARNCTFTKNKAKNGAALTVNSSSKVPENDDNVIFSAENCLFSGNEVTGSGGAILIAAAAMKGQLHFNNCRFDGNKATSATSHGAAFYSNNTTPTSPAPMVFFNACSFYKNSKSAAATATDNTGYGYEIYGNTGSRIAFNNCTINTPNNCNSNSGCDITCLGQTVMSNCTIWGSAYTGKRALATIASKNSGAPSVVVNCMIHHKNTTNNLYNTLFLSSGYYLNMSYCIYMGLDDDDGSAISGTDYNFSNCYNRPLVKNSAPAGAAYKTNNYKAACTVEGITHEIYYYTCDNATYSGFTCATRENVIDAVESNSTIGTTFSSWLKSLKTTVGSNEYDAYDLDMLRKVRTTIYPGSYHNTQN